VESSTIPLGQIPTKFNAMHARMLGKLEGFLGEPEQVLANYETGSNVRARYGRAVALFRLARTDEAIQEMDALVATSPDDPFFHELKGQILFESGRIAPAQKAYAKAVELLPEASLIRVELARSLLADADHKPDAQKEAILHLEYATSKDKQHPNAWHLLGVAYGKAGQLDKSHLALAEEALLLNDPEQALQQIRTAEKHIQPDTPAEWRAQDLRIAAQERLKQLKKKP